MIKLEGKLFKANIMIGVQTVTIGGEEETFVKELEKALILLCKALEIPIPLWLSKNTHEFAAFRQTIFFAEQYVEPVKFDRFQIRLL
ncbi:MAG: hypothetical protein JW780_00890 [Clostridiales bacterium]|nr:hypothetical protein [Clostridiales bacterium]